MKVIHLVFPVFPVKSPNKGENIMNRVISFISLVMFLAFLFVLKENMVIGIILGISSIYIKLQSIEE